MFKRFTNRQLAIFLLATLALYGLSLGFGGGADRTFEKTLSVIDTAQVREVVIQSNGKADVRLSRTGTGWQVDLPNGQTAPTEDGKVERALDGIATLEAMRLVSRSEDDWGEFGVSDSAATRVKVVAGESSLDVLVGRFEYQPSGMMNYVRLAEQEETYLVSGYLQPSFSTTANEWRDKTLTSGGSNLWQGLSFAYPGDSAFTLTKDSLGAWIFAEAPDILLDETEVSTYLTSIGSLRGQTFADQVPAGPPSLQVNISTPTGPLSLSAYADGQGGYLVASSANPGAFFEGEAGGLFEKVFVEKEKFVDEVGEDE